MKGLWVSQTWMWCKSPWRRSAFTHLRAARTYTELGKQTLGEHKQSPCSRTQEKGAVTPQETDPDLPVSVQESLEEAWAGSGLLQVRGNECASACMGPLEGGHHYLHHLHHSLVSGQATGREHSPAHQQKVGLEIY